MRRAFLLAWLLTTTQLFAQSAADPLQNVATLLSGGPPGPAGTVTSVGLQAPEQFSISGSPVVTFGTLSFDWVFSDWAIGECLSRTGANTTGGAACSGSGAPSTADYLVGTANAGLSAEIVVGTAPGGELGNTWASPTIDDSVAVTSWNLTTPTITGAAAWEDGTRQTFNPNGTNAGLNVGSQAGDPSTPSNGDLWYDSTGNSLDARINGATVSLGAGGGSVATDAIWDAAGDLAVGTGANTAARVAIGAAGLSLVSDGTTAAWIDPRLDPQNVFLECEFISPDSGAGCAVLGSGTGNATVRLNDNSIAHPGLVELQTGTTTTGYRAHQFGTGTSDFAGRISPGGGVFTYVANVSHPTLSDGTDTYYTIAGMCDLITGGTATVPCTDGIGFAYFQSSSTFWKIYACSNGTCTVTNTTNTVTAGQHYQAKTVCNAGATSCNYYLDGTEVSGSPISSNVPTGAARGTNGSVSITKTAGTNNSVLRLDYMRYAQRLTTAR